ncbi:glycosyltransferase family 2 protein [Pararhizobium mangrovi]|uniref:glycosyltransferase family 2 protein n=1 Tax=Pararhizobium mangrovi TaxID=2590452 RepID=UPI0015E87604|nr:glycosyltransferase family A protein [Pararhizobium mangrovi]
MALVSVLTPAANAARTILACIESVGCQRDVDLEHVVVDDGSCDATAALVEEACRDDPRLKLVRHERSLGAGPARNRAAEAAGGRFVAFLDADDRWLPDKLSTQLAYMRGNAVAFSYGAYRVYRDDAPSKARIFRPPATLCYADLLASCPIGCSTVMLDRERTGQVAMPAIRSGQDWAYWLALTRSGLRAHAFPGVHTAYTVRRGSLSANKLRKLRDVFAIYRDQERLSPLASCRFLAAHAQYVVSGKRRFLAAERDGEL